MRQSHFGKDNWSLERRKSMNNFIFENATKIYFGKGCVKEYLASLAKPYGQTVMLAYGSAPLSETAFMMK